VHELEPQQSLNNEVDLNNDGIVTSKEEALYEKKAVNRRRMAWLSLIALIVSGICVMFVIPESRLKSLSGLLELYFISLAGIVGAYVGISTWMNKR
jgi:cytochrome bd-type quinol oxidase subunit 2